MILNNTIKAKVLSGLFWKFSERISAQLVTFIVSIVLARLLEPSHYGAIAIVNIFIAFANVLVSSGFGNSLIQKKDADNLDYSSVFYANIFVSIILYIIIFSTAPIIASFYRMEILSPTLRVLGLRIIIAGINSVQHAYVSRNMLFKRFFWSTLFGTLLSGVIGIALAYKGFGIWALVAQYMTNTCVDTIVLWFTVRWRPILQFSFKRLTALLSYGWKLLASALLDTGYQKLRSLVIGKMYTVSDLALYDKGKSFPDLIVTNINASIQNVLFPAMSDVQDNRQTVKAMTRRSIEISSYIMLPLMVGLALIAEPVIKLLITEVWLGTVPYLRIYCFIFAFYPIHTSNLQALKAIGRSDLFLKLEIIKKVIGIIALLISMQYGVFAIAISGIITTIISSIINSFPNHKLLNYNYFEQIKDLLNGIIPLSVMAVTVFCVGLIKTTDILLVIIQILVGGITYIGTSYLTKNDSFFYILDTAKNIIKRK